MRKTIQMINDEGLLDTIAGGNIQPTVRAYHNFEWGVGRGFGARGLRPAFFYEGRPEFFFGGLNKCEYEVLAKDKITSEKAPANG